METKNEPKTLEEANYEDPIGGCCTCTYASTSIMAVNYCICRKFEAYVDKYGVCDCYD